MGSSRSSTRSTIYGDAGSNVLDRGAEGLDQIFGGLGVDAVS
jgi:hypothetical protein